MTHRTRCLVAAVFLGVFALVESAEARTKLENICALTGQEEHKLQGVGLVVGLKGTGDGDKYLPTLRAMGAALRLFYNPVETANDLKGTKNVALVLIEATVPAHGIVRGQKLDCYVSAIGPATSLRGGRLLSTPLGGEMISDERVLGAASGYVSIEDREQPNSGKIAQGVIAYEDITKLFLDKNGTNKIRLAIDADHAGFHSATEIATAINDDYKDETGGGEIAIPLGPSIVEVQIPELYKEQRVKFVSQVLGLEVEGHAPARVVINSKSGIVIATGDVEIEPIVFNHKSMTVQVGGGSSQSFSEPGVGFSSIKDNQARYSPQKLQDLVEALNQLRVPTSDVVEIIKNLRKTGKLHAEVVIVE